ncbi:MAG: hypothetical protein ACXABY_36995 [Candidatus Thorarchaeota archaeon]|jgi:hypothetical protein
MPVLTEAAIALLQIYFTLAREAGLDDVKRKELYDQVDADFMKMTEKPLPDA